MSIIIRLAERYINRRFLQSILFVLGVALGVAMVIAIDVANSSAKRAFSLSTESITGSATHQIIGGPSGLSTAFYRQIRTELGIRTSAPVINETVRALELNNQPMRLLGVDPFAEAPFRPYLQTVDVDNENTTDTGFDTLTRFISEPNTVLLSETAAARFNINVGDTLTLRAGTRQVNVTVIGLLRPDDTVSEQALDDLLLVDIATAQEVIGRPGFISRIDLILQADAESIIQQIQAILPAGARLGAVDENNGTLAQMTEAFELNLQALSLLALVVGVFLIYNTVTFSVVQRRPVIGILRAIGATKQQIMILILSEAVILSLVGTALGLGLGVIFGRGAVNLVSRTISDLYFTVNVQRVNVEPFILIKGAGIGVFASLLTAFLPAFLATRVPPVGVMRRSQQEQTIWRLLPYITGVAVILGVGGLLVLGIQTTSVVLSFVGLFMIVVGGALLTPIALVVAMRLIPPVTGRLFGVVGWMAPRAVVRSLSRTSIAVAALTIAVSVIVGVSVMIASFRNTVDDWLGTTLGSDIYIAPPLLTANFSTVAVDPAIVDLVLSVDGVTHLSTSRDVNVVAPEYPDLPPVNLQAVDFDIAVERQFAWRSVDDYWAALENGAVIVSEPFAFRRGITQDNAQITLLTDRGEQTFPIVGVFYDYSTDQGKVYMARTFYDQYFDDPFISAIGLYISDDADIQAVVDDLRTALADYDLEIQANRELRSGVFEVFDNAFAITVALRLLATIVAFIGILSALLSLQLENTRQYGVLRANGMTPRQLWNFTLIQTGLMGIVAGLLSLPIGLALALVLLYVINVRSFGWTMDFYFIPQEFAEAFMVAVVAAFIAGVYPAYRITRLQISRAIRNE
ncbi:MAG: ABC transporter permease [Chloroflexi bacterium]|nr:MAG: ABC transporter permease [Chloroflexota bacterium]